MGIGTPGLLSKTDNFRNLCKDFQRDYQAFLCRIIELALTEITMLATTTVPKSGLFDFGGAEAGPDCIMFCRPKSLPKAQSYSIIEGAIGGSVKLRTDKIESI